MGLATLFVLRKRKRRRQHYWALSRAKPHPSRSTFLAGEEMDLPFPSPPFASLDQPDPFLTHSSPRASSAAGSVGSSGGGGDGGSGSGSGGAPAVHLYSLPFHLPTAYCHAPAPTHAHSSLSSPLAR